MTTWPTTTPISTTNLDAGSDNPSLARVELLEAVQNIKTIATSHFNTPNKAHNFYV